MEYGGKYSLQNKNDLDLKLQACRGYSDDANGDTSVPVTLPNGSVYTGNRVNNKKHG